MYPYDNFKLVFAFLFIGIFMLPFIFFILMQQKVLKLVRPENRYMNPGEVWLQLIPVFGLVWQFFVVSRISDSIKRELWTGEFSFESREYNQLYYPGVRPTYNIGLAYCILFCCFIIPCLGALCYVAGLICWIIYWVRLSEFKSELERRNFQNFYPPQPTHGDLPSSI
jgi:hypothetical protein